MGSESNYGLSDMQLVRLLISQYLRICVYLHLLLIVKSVFDVAIKQSHAILKGKCQTQK